MSKSPRIYLLILTLWAATLAPTVPVMVHTVKLAMAAHWFIGLLAAASAVFIAYF